MIRGIYQVFEIFNIAAIDYENVIFIAPPSEYAVSLLKDSIFEIMEGYVTYFYLCTL